LRTDLDALNALLLAGCRADEARVLDGRTDPVGAAMVAERDRLLAGAPEGFDLADVTFPLVDKQGCVIVKTNAYSVPIKAGTRVEGRVCKCRCKTPQKRRLKIPQVG
jgi:hypothetical protein